MTEKTRPDPLFDLGSWAPDAVGQDRGSPGLQATAQELSAQQGLTPSGKPTAKRSALPRGYRLFEYQIENVLGQGGFGIAYAATDVHLNAKVVIKEYVPQDLAYRTTDLSITVRYLEDEVLYQSGLDSFLVEARTLATFRHPNIVRVARFFEANHTGYMVLEYEEGESLRDWRTKHKDLTEGELVALLTPLLDGLDEVHRAGYLHRDIKPDNVYVRDEDGSLVLLDFGSARQIESYRREVGSVVTPGYAAIEQYGGDRRQGPWTDIYALGATLLWLISGQKPYDAQMRTAATDPQPKAVSIGQGRYSDQFLGAIDSALATLPGERPQSVADFRAALFAGQAGALGLHAALNRAHGEEGTEESRTHAVGPVHRLRNRFARFRAILLRPSDWPIASAMTFTMLITALLPMLITAYVNHKRSVESFGAAEIQNLKSLARSTSGRVSQLLADNTHLTAFLARDDDFAAYLQSHNGQRVQDGAESQRVAAKVSKVLGGIVKANPDVLVATVFDAKGVALNSSSPQVIGQNHEFGGYIQAALAGKPFMTGLVVGAEPGDTGVSFANPVSDSAGGIIGVVELRVRGRAIAAILESAREGSPELVALLIDQDGIVVHHADPRHLYKSLTALSPDKLQEITPEQRFRRRTIESLDMPELARHLIGAGKDGTVVYLSTISGKEEIAGYAPVKGYNWVVAMTENREVFEDPLQELYNRVIVSVFVVGLVFIFITRRIARRIVRPVQELTAAAHALKSADYDRATVRVTSRNEIGQLARVFNVMIDVLRQRERERERKKKG